MSLEALRLILKYSERKDYSTKEVKKYLFEHTNKDKNPNDSLFSLFKKHTDSIDKICICIKNNNRIVRFINLDKLKEWLKKWLNTCLIELPKKCCIVITVANNEYFRDIPIHFRLINRKKYIAELTFNAEIFLFQKNNTYDDIDNKINHLMLYLKVCHYTCLDNNYDEDCEGYDEDLYKKFKKINGITSSSSDESSSSSD